MSTPEAPSPPGTARDRAVILIGGGGHALVACDAAVASGWMVAGFVDDNPRASLAGHAACLGPMAELERLLDACRAAHLAVGNLAVRAGLIPRLGERAATVTHPRAWVSPSAMVGAGTLIGAMAVVQGRARIGAHCIINTGAIVEHDCELGENVHIAPRAALAGDVRVGAGTLVGVGAVVLPGVSIGAGAVIGGGAVVNRDVATGTTVVGVPAREILKKR